VLTKPRAPLVGERAQRLERPPARVAEPAEREQLVELLAEEAPLRVELGCVLMRTPSSA
jgi:hypothetical protein